MTRITVERYGFRQWAVYDGEDLVCLCAYRKGAFAVAERLMALYSIVSGGVE